VTRQGVCQANRKLELENWLINAFNGNWLRTENPTPMIDLDMPAAMKKKRNAHMQEIYQEEMLLRRKENVL